MEKMQLDRLTKSSWLVPALAVMAIWLGWQIVAQPLAVRLPPSTAIRIVPGSSEVLAKAAEQSWSSKDVEAADVLASAALSRQPFNVRAARVMGFTLVEKGSRDRGEQLVVLAGNWSLRDDPSHAWLVEWYLRRGDYGSAFAHIDTLLRRRGDLQASVFPLLVTSATQDPRATVPLAGLIVRDPSWRRSFIATSLGTREGRGLIANLALMLHGKTGALTSVELNELYVNLNNNGELGALKEVRRRMSGGRPPLLADGGFQNPDASTLLSWTLYPRAGITSSITSEGNDAENLSLNVVYNGFARGTVADQLLVLDPGRYRLTGRSRAERASTDAVLLWRVTCPDSGATIGEAKPSGAASWKGFSADFTVPANCPRQKLTLLARPAERRRTYVFWFDDLNLAATSGS